MIKNINATKHKYSKHKIVLESRKGKKVYSYMQDHPDQSLHVTDIVKLNLVNNIRSARYVFNVLLKQNLVRKEPNIFDCRSFFYRLV